jgi:hypothetical protein
LCVHRFMPRTTCFADCSPNPFSTPPGVPDGKVNIDDLFRVVNHWGQTNMPWGDVTDNNVIDIDDLFLVVNQWSANDNDCAPPACDIDNSGGKDQGGGDGPMMPNGAGGDGESESTDPLAIIQACIDSCGDDIACISECLREAGLLP